jgi:hypothetical protein
VVTAVVVVAAGRLRFRTVVVGRAAASVVAVRTTPSTVSPDHEELVTVADGSGGGVWARAPDATASAPTAPIPATARPAARLRTPATGDRRERPT